ncbi:MAG: carbamoyltransferase C-terminal domain-containing protein [Candidatus Micrarchaeaceae archaeon]
MYVLGVWDGHDSGAALLEDNKIVFAANEERFTKRKLEVDFPYNSIKAALSFAGIKPKDVNVVAFATTEFTKTLERIMPYSKEYYYMYRRRKMLRPSFDNLRHYLKYTMTQIGVLPFCTEISKAIVSQNLKHAGFEDFKIYAVDHHTAHAATAAFASGFKKSLVVTLDGLGDGLSGSISILENGKLERQHALPAKNSIGIFYEQVTNILGMRELEDEGKIMAMADYSYPFKFEENKLKDFFRVDGIDIIAKYSHVKQFKMLDAISWGTPREQFAYMAQQLLENVLQKFFENALDEFGIGDVAIAGGTMSNVKANMKIRKLEKLKRWFVFPHMGDGGMAMGAAMYANYMLNGVSAYKFDDAYLGPSYTEREIETALKKAKDLTYEYDSAKSSHAADLINDDNYVFWFQGRMEYGPRALGNRSILAKASSETVKDRLNLYVKKREWFQPFAPSMLVSNAEDLLKDVKGYDRFMTMAYEVKEDKADLMRSVMHVDMTARPQMVGNENKDYKLLLEKIAKSIGYGVVLNTSFNIHGMPIVMSPEDAIDTMKKTGTRYMFLGDYFVENKKAVT